MKPMKSIKKIAAGIVAVATMTGVAACGSSNDSGSDSAAKSNGPVEIEVWTWSTTGQQQAEAFNKSQNEVKVKVVLQASNTAQQQNFRNAFEAKKSLPDLVQGFAPLTTNVANGWAEDITDSIQPILGIFSDGAKKNAELNGKYYGIPVAPAGQYSISNTDVLSKYGVEAPKTWDDLLALGKKANADGVKIFNLAGEDPSVLMQLAQEAGAQWFSIDGDSWKVNFLDDGTVKAAGIIQQMIDGKMVSNETWTDTGSLYKFFDSGKLAFMTTQYWSVPNFKTNMPSTSGKWQISAYPEIDGTAKVPGIVSQVDFVPKGTDKAHQDAVMKWEKYINSDEGIEAGRDKASNTVPLPSGLSGDLTKYVKANIPEGFYSNPDDAVDIINTATKDVMGGFNLGPNYDAWFPELQDQWGKAVNGQITVKEALKNTQDFVAKDLKSKGINYKVD
ncbi:extracellular solute-binding protein [Bifidobacterium sp. SO1]|uniref:ABC transporter substrate-binding protein n=1 Tax=Bifidobacterium sp. SO1 TaxID=2809029 RepID=UPI001BDD8366|nr:extracellular solute-binding protein [Bifidobacterium sp. SO1]MBT1160801.1 extracellular solute-binding protein [Bifidobacterium sp. SO1]